MKLFNRELPSWAVKLVPPAIIFLGLLIMIGFIASRGRPPQKELKVRGALVDVLTTEFSSEQVIVRGTGTVDPRQQVNLIPQVSGRVDWVSSRYVAGGAFEEGEVMLRIEQDDYKLAVQQAEAAVAQAQYQFDVAKANAQIARKQWERLQAANGDTSGNAPDPLVLHEPQLRQAEAAFKSAEASLRMARLNLRRTEIRAPFNGRIRSENVSVGQVVGPQTQLGSFYGTDAVEVEVGLTNGDLAWIDVPGSSAEVLLQSSEGTNRWEGRVERSTGVLDDVGRLARVFVVVDNPNLNGPSDAHELSIGSFVTVNIAGKTVENVVSLPRKALHENSKVWVATPDSTLDIRTVTIVRSTPNDILISEGLAAGELVILTSITGAAPGMKLRPRITEVQR